MGERREDKIQWCPNNCACGSKGGAYLRHYEIMRCDCGKHHWALQPDADGPFILFPWLAVNTRFNHQATKDR
jgi:hypothetical protein